MWTFDLLKGTLNPLSQRCSSFLLWAEVPEADPYYLLIVCEIKPDEEDQPAHVGERSAKLGVEIYSAKDAAKNQQFGTLPEVYGAINNWLLMAEQAGVAAQADCVVCLEPRPMLRMVPLPPELTAKCIIDLMANTAL